MQILRSTFHNLASTLLNSCRPPIISLASVRVQHLFTRHCISLHNYVYGFQRLYFCFSCSCWWRRWKRRDNEQKS